MAGAGQTRASGWMFRSVTWRLTLTPLHQRQSRLLLIVRPRLTSARRTASTSMLATPGQRSAASLRRNSAVASPRRFWMAARYSWPNKPAAAGLVARDTIKTVQRRCTGPLRSEGHRWFDEAREGELPSRCRLPSDGPRLDHVRHVRFLVGSSDCTWFFPGLHPFAGAETWT
jgi:hypothetical protein